MIIIILQSILNLIKGEFLMGFINLLKNGYRGKLGETVGQKWKNQLTVRTYQSTNNSKSQEQLDQRAHYKKLIQESSRLYPSTFNIIVPKKKSMNKFNFFTSNIKAVFENLGQSKFQFPLGDYRAKNVLSPFAGIKNDAIYAYIILPYGQPPQSILSIPQSIILGMDDTGNPISMPDGILEQEIIPKRVKAGATPYPFPRGYFVKTKIDARRRDVFIFSIGQKEKGAVRWSELTMIQPVFQITDNQLEDL